MLTFEVQFPCESLTLVSSGCTGVKFRPYINEKYIINADFGLAAQMSMKKPCMLLDLNLLLLAFRKIWIKLSLLFFFLPFRQTAMKQSISCADFEKG